MKTISNSDDVIDSREVIERIESLETMRDMCTMIRDDGTEEPDPDGWADQNPDDAAELAALKSLAEKAEDSPDWRYGETLIRESYFTDYIEELIADCYKMPKEMNSSDWPWRHVTIDYEAAADEAKDDYIECDFDGVTYLIRA